MTTTNSHTHTPLQLEAKSISAAKPNHSNNRRNFDSVYSYSPLGYTLFEITGQRRTVFLFCFTPSPFYSISGCDLSVPIFIYIYFPIEKYGGSPAILRTHSGPSRRIDYFRTSNARYYINDGSLIVPEPNICLTSVYGVYVIFDYPKRFRRKP